MSESPISSLLQGSYGQFARNAGEIGQKFIKRLPCLQVIQQYLERHTGACEARGATHYVRYAKYGRSHILGR